MTFGNMRGQVPKPLRVFVRQQGTFSRRLSAPVSTSRGRSGLHGTLRHDRGGAKVCRCWAACTAHSRCASAMMRGLPCPLQRGNGSEW